MERRASSSRGTKEKSKLVGEETPQAEEAEDRKKFQKKFLVLFVD